MKEIITTAELSRVLNISDRQIRNLAEKGIFTKLSRGKFNLTESVQAYISFKVNEFAGRMGSIKEERTRLIKLQADKVQFELNIARGDYLPFELFVPTWQELIGSSRSRLLSIPSTLKNKMPHLDNDVINSIDHSIREVLSEIGKDGIPSQLRKRVENIYRDVEPAAEADAE
jgi:phage terminase Nu1 subunit (DNA packaging protein)